MRPLIYAKYGHMESYGERGPRPSGFDGIRRTPSGSQLRQSSLDRGLKALQSWGTMFIRVLQVLNDVTKDVAGCRAAADAKSGTMMEGSARTDLQYICIHTHFNRGDKSSETT
jgi:hypothetical protein